MTRLFAVAVVNFFYTNNAFYLPECNRPGQEYPKGKSDKLHIQGHFLSKIKFYKLFGELRKFSDSFNAQFFCN